MKDSSTSNTAVCIAGAHRSGTSMLTRLLHACGLYLGPENELMPAQADNPDGFWEHLGFVALNDELLNELGGAWDLPPQIEEDFSDKRFEPLRTKAQLLIQQFDPSTPWGWKDPRNSLTLSFWGTIIPELRTILVVRNPLEVAHSLHQRNGLSLHLGLSLWGVYNQHALSATTPENRIVSHYDSFFYDPHAELLRIISFLGLPDSKVAKAAALISKERRHTHFTTEQLLGAQIPPQLFELYQKLSAEAGRVIEAELAASAAVAAPSEAGQRRSGKREASENALTTGAMSHHGSPVLNLAALEADRLRKQLAQHGAEFERLNAHIERISAAVHRSEEELKQRSISLAEQERCVVELTDRLRKQLCDTRRLLRLLDDVEDAAARLRSSRRWQIANPVAALKAKFSPARSSLGYGHLEKIVSTYQKWRTTHPEVAAIDDQIRTLISGAVSAPGQNARATSSAGIYEPPVPTRPIEFPVHEQVEISIIIPVFNQFQYTHACLGSLQTTEEQARFEVIVVDDCSTDETAELVPQMKGVVYLRNESNCGFIASCNRGAEKARGNYLLFLNNDTIVKDGWLSALVDTFAEEPQAGIVGSKLVYPDGRLQEAGGIIWQDASGWNYGKFDDPEKPEYNYLREVDYCSAAALVIPKALFQSVGGFDRRYAPAYYEDADLSFKVRRARYKVLYQPLSEVIHYEGATGGTDLSKGTKKHQDINRLTFADTWTAELVKKPATGDFAFLKEAPPGRKKILVIDHYLPMPDKDAGSVRMFHILNILRQLGHDVIFIPDNLTDVPPYGDELRKRGIEVVYHPYIKKVRDYLISHGSEFDAVVLSRCDFARKHIDDARLYAPQSRIIFDTVDLHFLRENRGAELIGDSELRRRAQEKQQLEYDLIDQADETWVVSSVEQKLLREARPNKPIEIVPTIVNVPGSNTPFGLRRDFLFIGGFQHTPNIDAVIFFVKKIYPFVKESLTDAKFYIIGEKAPPEVVALASENVIVTGLQRDVRPFFDSVKLSVAPLRYGAGIKGKINQSMGFGVPVVATSLAVEGMPLTDHQDILIADEPEDFAKGVVELYESEELWNRLSENGIDKTKTHYSVSAVQKRLDHLFSDQSTEVPQAENLKMLSAAIPSTQSAS
ncbi:MAG: glycosyltransferase [Verrucomicrobia bacterium]|nr:MAG: glycosyltransferase [Verrucomicrobiota bacterium]